MTSKPVTGLRFNKKTGKWEMFRKPRDASHAIRAKNSKRTKVVRRTV